MPAPDNSDISFVQFMFTTIAEFRLCCQAAFRLQMLG
jgi:hypothetical protein